MICHICYCEAVGQCKDCGKFYCPDHGDVVCVKCRTSTSPPDKPLVISDLPEPKAGPVCYLCQGTAAGSCTICGKFYCSKHGGKERSLLMMRRGLCEPCHDRMYAREKLFCIFGVVWLLVMICGFVWAVRHSSSQPAPLVIIDRVRPLGTGPQDSE